LMSLPSINPKGAGMIRNHKQSNKVPPVYQNGIINHPFSQTVIPAKTGIHNFN
jgi:hypothetical protein